MEAVRKKIDKALELYGRFVIGLGTAGVLALGVYFISFGRFPYVVNPLNKPVIIFVMGYVFFDLLIREAAKAARIFIKKKVKINVSGHRRV